MLFDLRECDGAGLQRLLTQQTRMVADLRAGVVDLLMRRQEDEDQADDASEVAVDALLDGRHVHHLAEEDERGLHHEHVRVVETPHQEDHDLRCEREGDNTCCWSAQAISA